MQVGNAYIGKASLHKPYTVQNMNDVTNNEFLAALVGKIKAGEADADALRTAMDASGRVVADFSHLQTGVLYEVSEAEKLELARVASGEALSPEAAKKQEELMDRLARLCAGNPNVRYKINGDLFQRMADDPEFEKKIYESIDAFERSGAAAMSVSPNSVSAMYMGAMGDWVMMNSPLDGEDWASSTWNVVYGSADGTTPAGADEVKERFPGMDDEMALVVAENLTTNPEGEIADIIDGWREHWENAAAQQDYDMMFEWLQKLFGTAFGADGGSGLIADAGLYEKMAAGAGAKVTEA